MTDSIMAKLALHGGTPVRGPEKTWPAWPVFGDEERRAVNEVLDSGKWWYGERVAQFEREYAAFQDARFCATCCTGTAAAEILMQVFDIRPGDEVIVPPYTFIATASSVMRMGGVPVFADVNDSWCLDPNAVEAAVTERTRMIVPVHFGGRVADMDKLAVIAEKHNLILVEDACHSWGSKWKGKGTGALGKAGVFSFQFSKNITAAEGGAITTDDESVYDACKAIINCGRTKGSAWYNHDLVGTNARISEFTAALLSAQLTRLEAQTVLREKNGAVLNRELSQIEGLTPQPGNSRTTRRAYHLYCLRLDAEAFGCTREKFVEAAKAEGLLFSTGYAFPLYKQPSLLKSPHGDRYKNCNCPVTEDLCANSALWLPHQYLLGSGQDMEDIIQICKKLKAHASEL